MDLDCGFTNENRWFRYRAAAIIVENGCALFACNETDDYFYSIGGGVHHGETAEDAVVREVFEETGVHYEIDHLAVIHENFFDENGGSLKGMKCHEISFYFLMKPRGTQELHSNSTTQGVKEEMRWIPIKDLDKYKAFPTFLKDYLSKDHAGIEHIVTDERVWRNLRKIYAGCYCDNKAGLRMLEKVGFVRYPAGDQKEENCFTGKPTIQLSFEKENVIETKDLILRQGSTDDWQDLYHNLWSREEVFRYMFNKPSPDEEAGRKRTALYAQMHEEVKTEFFVCEKASGQAIGIAGIKELKPGCWTITDIAIGPDFHGKGYGKQIVTALLNLAFEQGAAEVAYDCFTQNTVSKQLALSCGFDYSHSEEAELMKNGEKVILDYYNIRRLNHV